LGGCLGRNQKSKADPDRYLINRSGVFQYMRRVPNKLRSLDERGRFVRVSLKTDDLMVARVKRDQFEDADNKLWAALSSGDSVQLARAAYDRARGRAEGLGFKYQSASDLASKASDDDLLSRLQALESKPADKLAVDAIIGAVDAPKVKMGHLLQIYFDEIATDQTANKSASQLRIWRNIKTKSVANFIELVGDKPISEITRDDALKVYQFWQQRIVPKGTAPTHTASSGNRVIGNLRKMLNEYQAQAGIFDYVNPFAGLSFRETDGRTRPSFSSAWIQTKFLCSGALPNLNKEARGIFLMMIDSGARPGEICNIVPERIVLDHDVPHLVIAPVSARENFEGRREIKTATSKRRIPLVGVSLAVAQAFPNGFPRYFDKESSWSALVNKYLGNNGLKETTGHTTYSLRHSFEDRMKEAGVDEELRKILMGHSNERPKYGQGGQFKWQRDQLAKIVLPFDPSIVEVVD
jgi:integrase